MRSMMGWALLSVGIVACGGEDGGGTGTGGAREGNGKESSSGGTATGNPAPAKTAADALGPACAAYVECCKSVASSTQASAAALRQACDSWTSQYEQSRKAGATVEQFESACTTARSSLKSAGYCK